MLDRYLWCEAVRLSPEAPVPVLRVVKEEFRPGGAGNVAACLAGLGANVVMLGEVGDDDDGQRVMEALRCSGVENGLLMRSHHRNTTTKTRIMAGRHQIVRLDSEEIVVWPSSMGEVERIIEECACSGYVLSDYGKGFVSDTVSQLVIAKALHSGFPVIVDPRGDSAFWSNYRGATLVKPNLRQAQSLEDGLTGIDGAEKVLRHCESRYAVVTCDARGAAWSAASGEEGYFLGIQREAVDVTGAGDVVSAVLAYSLAAGIPIQDAVRYAVLTAGRKVERLGTRQVMPAEIDAEVARYLKMATAPEQV